MEKQEISKILHEALLELYLNVKSRSSEEINYYDQSKLNKEFESLKQIDPLILVKDIKNSVEIILNKKRKLESKIPEIENSERGNSNIYEEQLQKFEEEIRAHIGVRFLLRCD